MQHLFRSAILLLLLSFAGTAGAQGLALPGVSSGAIGEAVDTSTALIVIADIQITGYKRTKDYIVEREIPFKKGEYMLQSHLEKQLTLCRQQLMNTSLFVDVEVTYTQHADQVCVFVNVKERWYFFPLPYFKVVGRNFNEWWVEQKRSLNRINYGLKFEQYNVSGRNDKLKLYLISGYSQEIQLRYENPYLDKNLKHGMGISVNYNRNREVNYNVLSNKAQNFKNPDKFLINSYQVGLSYSYRPAIRTRHHVNFSLTSVSVDSTILDLNPRFFPHGRTKMLFPELGYAVEYHNVDYNAYPLKGVEAEGYFSMRMSNDYTSQVTLKGLFSKEVFPTSYLQFQAAGLIRLPFDQYFNGLGMMGGSDLYMRGLEYYVIQGVAGGVARGTAIKQALAFTLRNPIHTKTHDKLPFKFMLKAFGDLGYAYLRNPQNSMLNNRLLYTYGAGVDVISVYDMVLKVEYSFNQLGEQGIFIHTHTDF